MPRIAIRDLFLCQMVAFAAFIASERVLFFYSAFFGFSIMAVPTFLLVYLAVTRRQQRDVILPYAAAFSIGLLILVLKW